MLHAQQADRRGAKFDGGRMGGRTQACHQNCEARFVGTWDCDIPLSNGNRALNICNTEPPIP
eukprot:2382913-Prymnesium_polylepis.3